MISFARLASWRSTPVNHIILDVGRRTRGRRISSVGHQRNMPPTPMGMRFRVPHRRKLDFVYHILGKNSIESIVLVAVR